MWEEGGIPCGTYRREKKEGRRRTSEKVRRKGRKRGEGGDGWAKEGGVDELAGRRGAGGTVSAAGYALGGILAAQADRRQYTGSSIPNCIFERTPEMCIGGGGGVVEGGRAMGG